MKAPEQKFSHSRHIELNLHEVSQLFNSMDPSPFNEKDLDHDAEEFIVSWALEYSDREPLSLRIHLSKWPEEDPTEQVRQAIHHYFTYRAKITHLELRQLFRQGRASLVIGLSFLLLCLTISRFLVGFVGGTPWAPFMRESFLIAGWVAMWKPMQTFLYDWWPIKKREKVFRRLSRMSIEVVRKK
jgi:hypothetical protein